MSISNGHVTNPLKRWPSALRLAALGAIISFIAALSVTRAQTEGSQIVTAWQTLSDGPRMKPVANTTPAFTHVRHADNGVWLGHAYMTAPSYVEMVPALADDMQQHYSVLYW